MSKYKEIAQIVINITLISTVIGVLFFTYGKDVEKLIVQNQSKYIAESLANDAKIFFPEEVRKSIADSITIPDMQKEDDYAKSKNDCLRNKAVIVFAILCLVGLLITIGICWYGKVSKKHIFIEAFVILCFAVATEVLFLNVIARNYKSADPNVVRLKILQGIKKEFSTQ